MKLKTFLAGLLLAFAACAAWAQGLTTPQLQTLKTAIAAETDPAFVGYRTNGQTSLMSAFFNGPSTFVVWRTNVTASEIGEAWLGTDIDGMSALNMQRLELLLASSAGGTFNMARADRRAGFENPFGTNVSNPSRVAMRAAWQRFATRFERLFVTGTGTAATPGLLAVEGRISDADISAALQQ